MAMQNNDILTRISDKCISFMKDAIADSNGNEVFFTGKIDESGLVTNVEIGSRGNDSSVVVNFPLARTGGVLIHNHPNSNLTPSNADMSVASWAAENLQGFYIINNSVTKVYCVVEPYKSVPIQKLDTEPLSMLISNGGTLSKQSPNFEERPVQIDLLKNITDAFNDNSIAAFEAGTGVGKSFAYLLPAMMWATVNKQRIVISTGTINLQQQLIEKDIPVAEKIIGKQVKSILLKGRQNYICLRRLESVSTERDLFNEDTEIFDRVFEWSKTTETGSKSDLSFFPKESVWSRINSESDACMGMHCPFRDKCFVMKVRKEAADANILVVNHHLLFADIESRMNGSGYDDTAVLPPYKRIVFDEAHGIETAATSFFSESITRFKIIKKLNLLYRIRKGSSAGYIFTLQAFSQSTDNTNGIITTIDTIKGTISNLEIAALDIINNEYTLRLSSKTHFMFAPVLSLLITLGNSITQLVALVQELMEGIDEDNKNNNAFWETKSVIRNLTAFAKICKDFSTWDENKDMVFWMQKSRLSQEPTDKNSLFVTFTETPLDISYLMNKGVFEPMDCIVCTSATLEIDRNFSYWMRRTGVSLVEKERLRNKVFPSPFPYEKNVLLAVPTDFPLPDNIEFQNYVNSALLTLIKAAAGRTLVLFTSYDTLKNSYNATKSTLIENGITLLKQGDDDRFRLLDAFKNDKSSVLYATDSFWQGIDVPGNSLSQVIIVKLPFSVPNDPVFAARSEKIEQRGGSPFMELSLPEAVIKFRQGFGRLIRRSDDKGVVVVLDRRIVTKQYGRIFLSSIPETKKLSAPVKDIASKVSSFLN